MLTASSLLFSQQKDLAFESSALPQSPDSCPPFEPLYNAAARTSAKAQDPVFVTAEFLYWYIQQDTMDLAQNTVTQNNIISTKYAFPDFEYQPGFRLGFGANFDYDK